MQHRSGLWRRPTVALDSRHGLWVLAAFCGAMVLSACAPTADSTVRSSVPSIELEVMVATNCDLGADVVIEVEETTHTFAELELLAQAGSDLPFVGSMRVPWSSLGPYRVTMAVGCDDDRVKEITTFRVEGDVRTIVSRTTTTGRGVATSAGSM